MFQARRQQNQVSTLGEKDENFNEFILMLFHQSLLLVAGGELRGGVNPLKDRLKLDNCVTRAMQVVMKLVRDASNH